MPNSAISFNTAGLASATSPGLVGTGAQTFAGAKTFQNGLVFASSSLSDAQATAMGLKQYLHGTTYNGGIAPTVTCAQSGFAVTRALFIPYQVNDGSWRLKFNVATTFTSATLSTLSVAVNGVTSKNITGFTQVIQAVFGNYSGPVRGTIAPNNGNLSIDVTSGVSTTGALYSGDVELESKPTWAY